MSAGTSSVPLNALLKKTEHYDKDERYMATSDLCEALKRHAAAKQGQSASSPGSSAAGGHGYASSSYGHHQQSSQVIDTSTERRICTAVLKLLDDKSNDVQAIAVKTLGVLLTTVHEEQVIEIADRLCTLVLDSDKSELRDVYTIGLRTLVKTVPIQMGDLVSHRLVGRLVDGIRSNSTVSTGGAKASGNPAEDKSAEEITLCCLDVLTDLLTRFGSVSISITRQHEQILHIALSQLASARPVVRKRAGNAIGCLAVVISDTLLERLVESLLSQIDLAEGVGRSGKRRTRAAHRAESGGSKGGGAPLPDLKVADTRALIRTMCTVSGAVGHRLGQRQIDRIVPIFLRFCDPEDAVSGDDEDEDDEEMEDADGGHHDGGGQMDEAATSLANELRESCFAGFESFILRCPNEIEPHLSLVIHAALSYMRYDPNYSYGDDDDEEDGSDGENGGDGSDAEEEEDEYEDDDEDEYSDGEDDFSDDDDDSWKVRRSAIRTLSAVVRTAEHDPSKLWIEEYAWRRGGRKGTTVAGALVNRFKEREENCRVDVVDCFARLLGTTVAASKTGVLTLASPDDAAMDAADSSASGGGPVVIDLRTKFVPAIVKACEKQLSAKRGGERTKSSALALLSTLCNAPGGIGGKAQIASVFVHVKTILGGSGGGGGGTGLSRGVSVGSKSLKLDALCLVRNTLTCGEHDPADVKAALLDVLLPELCKSVNEDWYKVIAEALRVLSEVPTLLVKARSDDAGGDAGAAKSEMDSVASSLYNAIEPRLAAHDLDQEIKECALAASASLLSVLHASLSQEQTGRLLALLLERLKNETTRIAAIKTLSVIGAASQDVEEGEDGDGEMGGGAGTALDLSPILAEAVLELASLLRQQSRGIKQSALEALVIVVRCQGADDTSGMDADKFDAVLKELGAIIVDSDLHISHLSLRASMSVLQVCPPAGPSVKARVLPSALALSTSPLLQDLALDSLLALLRQLVLSDAVEFGELLGSLRGRLAGSGEEKGGAAAGSGTAGGAGPHGGSKQAVTNLAKCVAVITAATTPENRAAVVSDLLSTLEARGTRSNSPSAQQLQLALLTSGDLGRIVDLSAMDGVAPRLQAVYLASFESTSDDVKHAAAYALGRASVGAMPVFLPAILDALEENGEKKRYLLLSALRELIHCHQSTVTGDEESSAGGDISESVPLIMPHLFEHCGDKEEGVRTMVAECLGSLTCLQPDVLLPQLKDLVEKHSGKKAPQAAEGEEDAEPSDEAKRDALICWTVATAVKFAIAGKADPAKLAPFMPSFLVLLREDDLSVKNQALLMVYSAVHHSPQLVAGLMGEHILPALHELAVLNLKRVVDLGPFKHTVDDAIPLRKAALSIFSTCLDKCPSCLDVPTFMPVLATALADVEDVQLQAHQIVTSMCVRHPVPIRDAVETFVEPLEKTVNKKKGQKTGTELERVNEWIKSGLRVMVALSRVDGVMDCRKFADFVDRTRKMQKFHPMLEAIDEER